MASRKARRSSILKTRNDGGSGELNFGEGNLEAGGTTRNLTGVLNKRRVSFSHTNQVKEFEKSNSSTEGSLSKTSDFNQTKCDLNMSISMNMHDGDFPPYEATKQTEDNLGVDMSICQDPNFDISVYEPNQLHAESEFGIDENRTYAAPGDMSVYQHNQTYQAISGNDANKTSVSSDMSVYQHNQTYQAISGNQANKTSVPSDMSVYQHSQIIPGNDANKSSLGMTICRDTGLDISVYQRSQFHAESVFENDGNKTYAVPSDMSVYQHSKTVPGDDTNKTTVGMSIRQDQRFDISVYQRSELHTDSEFGNDENKTYAVLGDMSIYHPNQGIPGDHTTNKTSIDMSIYQDQGFDNQANKTSVPSDMSVYQHSHIIAGNDADKSSLGMTICQDQGYNMSVYQRSQLHKESVYGSDENRTYAATGDMSVYQHNQTYQAIPGNAANKNKTSVDMSISQNPGYDMSVYQRSQLHSESKIGSDQNKTQAVPADMSVYQHNEVIPIENSNKTSIEIPNCQNPGFDMSVYQRSQLHAESEFGNDENKTFAVLSDKSVYEHNHAVSGNDTNRRESVFGKDVNRTYANPKDMSVYQSNQIYHSIPGDSANKNKTSVDMSICQNTGFDMSVYQHNQLYADSEFGRSQNKTHAALVDMSVYQHDQAFPGDDTNRTSVSSNNAEIVTNRNNPQSLERNDPKMVEENNREQVGQVGKPFVMNQPSQAKPDNAYPGAMRPGGTRLYFTKTDPKTFRDPFGLGKHKWQKEQEGQPQISFGNFGNAKTPKRNKFACNIVPQPIIVKKPAVPPPPATTVNEVQTSPMPAILQKHTKEVGLNCTIASHDNQGIDVSMMTSPMLYHQSSPVIRTKEEVASGKMSVCVGTSPAPFTTPPQSYTHRSHKESPVQIDSKEKSTSEETAEPSPAFSEELFPSSSSHSSTSPQTEDETTVKTVVESPAINTPSPNNLPADKVTCTPAADSAEMDAISSPQPLPPQTLNGSNKAKKAPLKPDGLTKNDKNNDNVVRVSASNSPVVEDASISFVQPLSSQTLNASKPTPFSPDGLAKNDKNENVKEPCEAIKSTGNDSQFAKSFVNPIVPEPAIIKNPVTQANTFNEGQTLPVPPKVHQQSKEVELNLTISHHEQQMEISMMTSSILSHHHEEQMEISMMTSSIHSHQSSPVVVQTMEEVASLKEPPASQTYTHRENPVTIDAKEKGTPKVSNEPSPAFSKEVFPSSSSHSSTAAPQTEDETTVKTVVELLAVNTPSPSNPAADNFTCIPTNNSLVMDSSISFVQHHSSQTLNASKKPPFKPEEVLIQNNKNNDTNEEVQEPCETNRTTGNDSRFAYQAYDENSFRRKSNKTQDVLVEETSFFESTRNQQTFNNTTVAFEMSHYSPDEGLPDKSLEVQNPSPTAGYIELRDKLLEYSRAELDIFEKWGFLSRILEQLSRVSEHEWDEIQHYKKIRDFFGDRYIKAVNINRSRLNDPSPLYRAAMQQEQAELARKYKA